MFCPKCGKEIPDDAVICTGCGRMVQSMGKPSAPQASAPDEGSARTISILAFILALLAVPVAPIVLSIVGLAKYGSTQYRGTFIFTLILSIVWPIIIFISITIITIMLLA